MEALRVAPGHPPEGRELEVLDRPPGTWPCGSADELGLVIAVHGLGQGVVIAVPDGPDRRCRSDLGEAFAVANGGELRPRVAVTAQVLMASAAGPAGHLDRVEDHLGAHV